MSERELLMNLGRELSAHTAEFRTGHQFFVGELAEIKQDVKRINGSIASAHTEIANMKRQSELHHPVQPPTKVVEQHTTTITTDGTNLTIGLATKFIACALAGGSLVLGVLHLMGRI